MEFITLDIKYPLDSGPRPTVTVSLANSWVQSWTYRVRVLGDLCFNQLSRWFASH